MKKTLFNVTLLILLSSLFSCGPKVYHVKCDDTIPKELAQTIESKTYVEGDNPLFGEGYSQIIVTIKKGKIVGFKQSVDGQISPVVEEPVTLAQEKTGGNQGLPIGRCATKFVECTANCGPAPLDPNSPNPTRTQCLEKCQAQYDLCRCKAGGLSKNIVIR